MAALLHDSHVLNSDTNVLGALGPANPITLYTAIANVLSYAIPNKNCAETRNEEVPGLYHSVGSLTGDSLTGAGFASVSPFPEGRTRMQGQSLRTPESTGTKEQSLEQIPDNSFVHSLSPDGTKSQVLRQSGPASEALSQDPLPEHSSSPAPKPVQPKQLARFALGGSCSSSEQSQSIENIKATSAAVVNKPMFQVCGPPREDSRKSSGHSAPPNTRISNLTAQALQQSESAVDSDTEAEYIDESAIDDDDSSDWEDSMEDSGKYSVDDKFFQRVESKANLTSRPSLITLMLAQNERARTLGDRASRSTPAIRRTRAAPNGPSLSVSPYDFDGTRLVVKGMRHSTLKPISEIRRSSAQPITTNAAPVNFPAAFSPRTTRRNMLATELPESLRLNLAWERQQKKLASKARLKRRHTSQDVANLQQYPQRACVKPSEDVEIFGWDEFFLMGTFNGYHFKGW
ncbi:hypothetical protein E5D57_013337 [Metarhizium anisopliae]|nr:hypothetical protein E5D57_013337 [Metarhizium anisopliae]